MCVFSPCIEQVQKTCDNLRSFGFSNIEILECVSRNFDPVHTVLNVPNLGMPPVAHCVRDNSKCTNMQT